MEDYYRDMNQREFDELYQDYDWCGDVCSRWPIGPGDCPICGADTVLRDGPYGRFFGCCDFPRCRGIRRYSQDLVPSKREKISVELEIRTHEKRCGEDCCFLYEDSDTSLPGCNLFRVMLDFESADEILRCEACMQKTSRNRRKWWVTHDGR